MRDGQTVGYYVWVIKVYVICVRLRNSKVFPKIFLKAPSAPIYTNFVFCQNFPKTAQKRGANLLLWESSENQFDQPKKKRSSKLKIFENFLQIRPPRENYVVSIIVVQTLYNIDFSTKTFWEFLLRQRIGYSWMFKSTTSIFQIMFWISLKLLKTMICKLPK